MSDERAARIKLIIFDVDAVMTDDTIFLFPAPAGAASHDTHVRREQMATPGDSASRPATSSRRRVSTPMTARGFRWPGWAG
jgi:hypothetical protein